MSENIVDQLRTLILASPNHEYSTVSQHLRVLSPLMSQREHDHIVRSTLADINGIGSLQQYLENPRVKEIMVVAGTDVFVEDHRGLHRVSSIPAEEVNLIIERILRQTTRRVDALSPIADVRLHDGSRVCIVIPPVAIDGPALSIRKFATAVLDFSHFGNQELVDIITSLVHDRANVVVAGATSSGKTSLLAAALSRCDPSERIVLIEDTAELQTQHPHVVRLEARPSNIEGVGEISLQHLVRTSLRLRPDRLIVGEVRGSEALDMLMALTSGHRGCWSTCHAQNPHDALHRLSALVMRGSPQWTDVVVRRTISSAIDYIVYVERDGSGARMVTHIGQVNGAIASNELHVNSIYNRNELSTWDPAH